MAAQRFIVVFLLIGTPATIAWGGACCPENAWAAGELIVTFHAGTEETVVERVANEAGTEVVRFLTQFLGGETYIIQVPVTLEPEYELRLETFPEVLRASLNGISCGNPGPPWCSCCNSGHVCATVPPCRTLLPVHIELDRDPNDEEFVIRWGPDCTTGDEQDHAIYEGILGQFASHQPKICSDMAPFMEERVEPSSGDRYYLVAPKLGGLEGSLGTDSRRLERLHPATACGFSKTYTPCPG